jgi:transcriptional regulator with XRE-family HTH domain
MTPSGKQIIAARSLAGWKRPDLADKSGLSTATIRTLEDETKRPKGETIEKIVTAFRNVGIEFTENDGVRRMPMGIDVFQGPQRFEEFMSFTYDYLEQYGGEICISVTDERYLQRTRKNLDTHRNKMVELTATGKIKGRILASEGNFMTTWAQLRRRPLKSNMPHISFFVFGDNLALIAFDHHKTPPYVALHKSSPFAEGYKNDFDAAWEQAEVIE